MRNIALKLQYNGSAYHGWQRQKNAITIQQILEDALNKILSEKVSVNGCGRTDSGVHALEYVCNFNTQNSIPVEKITGALNYHLPSDICCFEASEVNEDFHARFSVISKRYIYKILNRQYSDVFLKNLAWHYKYPLDIEKMIQASKYFIGEHDFAAFAASGRQTKTTVRTIYELAVKRENDIITIEVHGNGFLYNMVRIITGTLVYVGCGKIEPEEVKEIIESADRSHIGITAPPDGLYMAKVYY